MVYVRQATPGMAFDVDQVLNAEQCAAFKAAGNNAAIRYIPRKSSLVAGNLTAAEMGVILGAGLSLMAVQHCPTEGWDPSAELGQVYGQYGSSYAEAIGLPKGINLWLDLETPSTAATGQEVMSYANAWFSAVEAAGYVPGVYLGYGLPLGPEQLYKGLSFSHYWKAYNGPDLAIRGYEIVQRTQKELNGVSYDPNTISIDNLGGLPIWASPI